MKAAKVDDPQLLLEYAERRSESAFAELVHRHIGLVYSTAVRRLGNRQMAEDVTQAVFIILSKKAARLRSHSDLSRWLYRTTQLAAAQASRNEVRRRQRELSAVDLGNASEADLNVAWESAAPLLDDGLNSLRAKDRDGVLLHYLENRSMHEVASVLGCTREAAKKRVQRGVQKLRLFMERKGVRVSAVTLGAVLSSKVLEASPPTLVQSTCAVVAQPTANAPETVINLVRETMKIIVRSKLQFVGAMIVPVLLLGLAIPLVRSEPPGSLDTSFKADAALSGGDVRSLAIQADGKIIVAGSFQAYVTNNGGVLYEGLARLNANGSLDPTFCNSGHYRNTQSIALQTDNKILVAGSAMTFQDAPPNDPMPQLPAVLRLNADGSVDPGFSIGPNIDYTQSTLVYSVAVQHDGKTVIGGAFKKMGGQSFPGLARLNPDGSLDQGFHPPTTLGTVVRKVLVQTDGKLIVGAALTALRATTLQGFLIMRRSNSCRLRWTLMGCSPALLIRQPPLPSTLNRRLTSRRGLG